MQRVLLSGVTEPQPHCNFVLISAQSCQQPCALPRILEVEVVDEETQEVAVGVEVEGGW